MRYTKALQANTQANSDLLYPTAALLPSLLQCPLYPCGDAEPINSPSHPGLVHHSELVIDILEISLAMGGLRAAEGQ